MKIFSLIEPHSFGLLDLMVEHLGINRERFDRELHPQEDYLLISKRYPIFIVADGVTLEANQEGLYPNPSGAGEIARIFSEGALAEAERLYDTFSDDTMLEVFQCGNRAGGEYNRAQGKSKETSNFFDFDMFAATAAIVIAKGANVYWGTMCDSFVAQFGNDGRRVFRSPECWSAPRITKHTEKEWSAFSEKEQRQELRRVYRNGVDGEGNPIGYGVITGEEEAMKYVRCGLLDAHNRDLFLIYTDGFEHYIDLPEFIELFSTWPDDLQSRVKAFTHDKSEEDIPRFGRERSLIAVKVDGEKE